MEIVTFVVNLITIIALAVNTFCKKKSLFRKSVVFLAFWYIVVALLNYLQEKFIIGAFYSCISCFLGYLLVKYWNLLKDKNGKEVILHEHDDRL